MFNNGLSPLTKVPFSTIVTPFVCRKLRQYLQLLYDADRIEEAASTEREVDLYERQCEVFLDPHDPSVIEEALKQGIPQNVIEAAQRSPVYKMAMDWKLALRTSTRASPSTRFAV